MKSELIVINFVLISKVDYLNDFAHPLKKCTRDLAIEYLNMCQIEVLLGKQSPYHYQINADFKLIFFIIDSLCLNFKALRTGRKYLYSWMS